MLDRCTCVSRHTAWGHHQPHRFPQSSRVQRHQVLHPRRRPRPAESRKADRILDGTDRRHRREVTCGAPPDGGFETADVKPAFLKRLAELVDLKAIARLGTRVVYEEFWGAGRGYPSDLLRDSSVKVETVHDYRDVLCGGHAPEPYDPACTVRSNYQALRIADDLFLGTAPPRVGPECIL